MMDLQELERICLHALELSPSERPDYLDRSCTTEEMRREVESLLQVQSMADNFFAAPADTEDYGETGPYQIVEKLGEGGMGVVFRARQTDPVVREVAIKIIRPGMASLPLVARFKRERQALAIMDHPNIARVHDAGATSRGLPYLVMELVAGPTIADFCDANGLNRRERAALMIPICQAIQHAHLKGIIHRDIKPSNVLVATYDGKAVPKVIDFGIAKAIEGTHPGLAGETRAGVMIGTFEYVSPEQAEPGTAASGTKDVDTRTDIYSLGAMLYRLITGRVPLQGLNLESCTYSEILRRIREEMPPPAGAGELDWVLNKALEKDREQRYQTADALALDLRRYLEGEALEAGPRSAAYRFRKLAAKFKYGIAAAAICFVLLLAALGWMTFALRQQTRANSSAAALREVVRKIIIERPAQLAQIPNRTALRGQLMSDAEAALDLLSRDTGGDQALELELAKAHLAIGLAKGPYSGAGSEGDPAAAAPYVSKSVELYGKLAKRRPSDPVVRRGQIEALATWVHVQVRLSHDTEAEQSARQLISEIERMPPALRDQVQARWFLSMAYMELGGILWNYDRYRQGLELHRKALSTFLEDIPPAWLRDPEKQDHLAHLERELAISLWLNEGIGPEIEPDARRAVEAVEHCGEPNCRMRHAQSEGTLGEIQWAAGKKEQGIATLRQAVAEFETLAEEDPANAVYVNAGAQLRAYLALALAGGSEAIALANKNLRLEDTGADARLRKGRERTMIYQIVSGAALSDARRYDEAERQLREALDLNRDWNANDDLKWSVLHELTKTLEALGKTREALAASEEGVAIAQRDHDSSAQARIYRAVAARDYAVAVAHAAASTNEQRDRARNLLDSCCSGLDERYGALVGALLEFPPTASERSALLKLLER